MNQYVDAEQKLAHLRDAYATSGLNEVLEVWKTQSMEGGRYAKMLFHKNDFQVRSLEIHQTRQGPYVRIHWLEQISALLKERLLCMPGAVMRTQNARVGVRLDGDLHGIARGLARALQSKPK